MWHNRPMALRQIQLAEAAPTDGYPYELAAVRSLPITLHAPVTVLVGDNGSGKSTLIEAIAVAAGFNPEGGSGQVRFETEASHSDLAQHLQLVWGERLPAGWFLRAETFYNVATFRDHSPGRAPLASYHRMSHGESFLLVANDWFAAPNLFILDEPEAALSFTGQLALVGFILDGVAAGAQFVIATHSPIVMAIPGADVRELTDDGLAATPFDELEIVELWRGFLDAPERFLRHVT